MRINTLRPRLNERYFPDDIFKRFFLNENVLIAITISLKFVPMGPNNNIPALVQIMTWRRPGDKPLSEPMMASLLTHICLRRYNPPRLLFVNLVATLIRAHMLSKPNKTWWITSIMCAAKCARFIIYERRMFDCSWNYLSCNLPHNACN